MMAFLKKLVARHLNLDLPDHQKEPHEVCLETGASRKAQWFCIRMLLRQTLDSGSSAIHIFYDDDEDGAFRMLHCMPNEGEAWYEMVAGPNIMTRQILRRLMRCSHMDGSRNEGKLTYIYHAELRTADCVSPKPDELRIYFTTDRPRVLNKKAGDMPGVPTRVI